MKIPKVQWGVLVFATALGMGLIRADDSAPVVDQPAAPKAAETRKGNADQKVSSELKPQAAEADSDSGAASQEKAVLDKSKQDDKRTDKEVKGTAQDMKLSGKDSEVDNKQDKLQHEAGDADSQGGHGAVSARAPIVSTSAIPSPAAGIKKEKEAPKEPPKSDPAAVSAPEVKPPANEKNSGDADMYKAMDAFEKESQEDARQMRGEKGGTQPKKVRPEGVKENTNP
jgi:hypothetical protein